MKVSTGDFIMCSELSKIAEKARTSVKEVEHVLDELYIYDKLDIRKHIKVKNTSCFIGK